MGRIGASWSLAKASMGVILQDKELLLFPLASAATIVLIFISFFSAIFLTGTYRFFTGFLSTMGETYGRYVLVAVIFLFYLAAHFIALYFNCALVGAAMVRLEGRDPMLMDGIRAANARIGKILAWAILGGTVGYALRVLSQRSGLAGKIVVAILGALWGVATFFVIPVLIFEDLGPIKAIRRSLSLFRRTWVETVVGPLALGLIFFLLGLLGLLGPLVGLLVGTRVALLVGFGVALVYWLALGIVASAAQGVLVTALYRYATLHRVPPGFDEGQMTRPFFPKFRRGRRTTSYRTSYP